LEQSLTKTNSGQRSPSENESIPGSTPGSGRWAETGQVNQSAALRLATELRDTVRDIPPGTFLGSESEMMDKFQVSRPTLRAASALLARDDVIATRRGTGGGYFKSAPDSTAVTRSVASFLHMPEISMRQLTESVLPLRAEIVRHAASRGSQDNRELLRSLLIQDYSVDTADVEMTIGNERKYWELLSEMAGNPLLKLFSEVLSDLIKLGDPGKDIFEHHPAHILAYRSVRRKMAKAVIDGDSEVAALHSLRLSNMTLTWLDESDRIPKAADGFRERLGKRLRRNNV
jgi:DNA-binding FadR family transcriptional regulator